MGIRAVLTASVMTFTLVLAGCGSDSDEPTEAETTSEPNGGTSTTSAATGITLDGDGYSINAPEGWESKPELNPVADVMAVDVNDDDGFADNLNVLVIPNAPADISTDDLMKSARGELEATGVTDITEYGEVDIDGSQGIHLSSVFSVNALSYRVDQFLVAREGTMYTTTFSFSEDLAEADRAAVYNSVMASWTWK